MSNAPASGSGFAQNIQASETASPSNGRGQREYTESPPPNVQSESIEKGIGSTRRDTGKAVAPQTTIVEAIDEYVTAFRDNNISKPRAIALISAKLDFKGGVSTDEPEKEAALIQYLATLDSIERLESNAAERGAHAAAGLSQPLGHQFKQSEPIQPIRNEVDRNVAEFLESIATASKRGHDETAEEDTDGEDGERRVDEMSARDDAPASNRRRRLHERDMPWFSREIEARRNANPSCTKTREILQLYGEDVKNAKKMVIQSTSAPAGFPSSEWDNILRGVSIDLDKVFSSLHLVAPVKENVGRVGLTTISLGETEPRRRIQSSGDWISAWLEASQATAMLFPHRENELRAYGDHISREFSARVSSAHRKVILFDAAIRNAVGGGQSILLTEYEKFTHIHSAIMLADGIQSDIGGGASGSKMDICRRFNASQCPDGESCRFRHICRKCKKSGHGQVNHISRREKEGKADARTTS